MVTVAGSLATQQFLVFVTWIERWSDPRTHAPKALSRRHIGMFGGILQRNAMGSRLQIPGNHMKSAYMHDIYV